MKLIRILNEIKTSNYLILYHGTRVKNINNIKSNGLESKTHYGNGWYMLATDFESALYHATPDEDGGDVAVIEFKIPISDEKWKGYPLLWPAEVRTTKSSWYSLREPIPAKFIKKVHLVPFARYNQQKSKGF
jgi:hypothetical protein